MFTSPDFLIPLGVGLGVGLLVMVRLARPFRVAMKDAGQSESAVAFWSAVVQLCALLVPVITTLLAQQTTFSSSPALASGSVTIAACGGALGVVFSAGLIVAWATPEANAALLSHADSNELKQLLLRMREFRAQEIAKASEVQSDKA